MRAERDEDVGPAQRGERVVRDEVIFYIFWCAFSSVSKDVFKVKVY